MATPQMDPPVDLPVPDLFSLKGQNALITGATRGESNTDRVLSYHIYLRSALGFPHARRSIALFSPFICLYSSLCPFFSELWGACGMF
jgi:hypothetical protein